MHIGSYEITLGTSGLFRLDGGAMFGVVPRVMWEKHHPPDGKNRIFMSTNLLLIQGEGKKILVDTGNNAGAGGKMKSIYCISHAAFSLDSFLSGNGLTNRDITDVILTHLHFDHTGGAVLSDEKGNCIPAFPEARYHVQKTQYEWALEPTRRDRVSYRKEYFVPLMEAGQLNLLEGPGMLFPGIELLTFEGHTPGQQLPLIEGNGNSVFFGGDLLPLSSQINPPWIMSYDLNPLQTLREKEVILPRAVEENWTIVFEHDPELRMGTLKRSGETFAVTSNDLT